jgi:hypothetical protein
MTEIHYCSVEDCGRPARIPPYCSQHRGYKCPTLCDDDCPALCHEVHEVDFNREHDVDTCKLLVQRNVAPYSANCYLCNLLEDV